MKAQVTIALPEGWLSPCLPSEYDASNMRCWG